jgi:hypothetical protein
VTLFERCLDLAHDGDELFDLAVAIDRVALLITVTPTMTSPSPVRPAETRYGSCL